MRGKTQSECCSRRRFVWYALMLKTFWEWKDKHQRLAQESAVDSKKRLGENTAQLGSENTIAGGFKIAPVASVA